MKTQLSPDSALFRLGLKQTIRGALIVGAITGTLIIGQGAGYAVTYPDAKSRAQFAATLTGAPGLGILYGEAHDLQTPAGYMVYRSVPIMTLLASVWALMAATKLLRGQEEDGRLELIAASSTTMRRASAWLSLGFGASFLAAFLLCLGIVQAGAATPAIQASVPAGWLLSLAMFLPAALFAAAGLFVSQLSVTRRHALLYGLLPLLILFVMRAVGNTVHDLHWLKTLTPFGWSDMVSPITNPQVWWLVLPTLLAAGGIAAGIFLAGKRDLGEGLVRESSVARSHFALLGSTWQLALRQNSLLFASWAAVSLAMSAIIAAITSLAVETLTESSALKSAVGRLGGTTANLKIAFLGAGMVFTVMVLMIMVTTAVAAIRRDEAKSYVDTLLTQPIRRSWWLAQRLMLVVGAFVAISLVSSMVMWLIARAQDIAIDLGNLLQISVAQTGTAFFLLGLGALLYGLLPRLAMVGMYIVIGWSFAVDIIQSVIKLNDIILKSSLFHYASFSLSSRPDWEAFAWLVVLGVGMASIGVVGFGRRDITAD